MYKGWVVGWMCGRGLCGNGFLKGVLPGYLDEMFLGRMNGCELRASYGFFWVISNGPRLGDLEGVLVRNSRRTLAG